jgi:peptide/nickel transport system permease protein
MALDAKSKAQNESKVARLAQGSQPIKSESLYQKAIRRFWKDRLSIAMLVLLGLLVIFSLSAPLIESAFGVSYRRTAPTNAFQPILSEGHILGTDDLGRDHLARLSRAGQITLAIAFSAALLSLTIGLSVGIATGFYGGVVDDVIMWMISTINSIPQLFLLVILAAVLRPGPVMLILVLGLLGWTGTTRLVRGETLSLREREYVLSARAMGASDLRIMATHIAPNLISILVVTLAIDVGQLMLAEAALSFLGLGVQPPTPTWGNMLTGAQQIIQQDNSAHLAIFPGVLITLTVLSFYVIGDGIRDAFDPTLEK